MRLVFPAWKSSCLVYVSSSSEKEIGFFFDCLSLKIYSGNLYLIQNAPIDRALQVAAGYQEGEN